MHKNLPERDPTKPAEEQGLFEKFTVLRNDGTDAPGGKHHGCRYFVLDVDHDPYAAAALGAYADACEGTHPALARDLREKWGVRHPAASEADRRDDAIKGYIEQLKHANEAIDGLRHDVRLLTEQKKGEIWRWQSDGGDHLESMAGSMGIVISAGELRSLLGASEANQWMAAVVDTLVARQIFNAKDIEQPRDALRKLLDHAASEATGKPALQVAASEAGAVPVVWVMVERKRNSDPKYCVADPAGIYESVYRPAYFVAPPSAPAADQRHPIGYVAEWCATSKHDGKVTLIHRSRITNKHPAEITAAQWAKESLGFGPMRVKALYAAPAAESAEPVEVVGIDPMEGTGDGGPHEARLLAQRMPTAATADAQPSGNSGELDAQGDERAAFWAEYPNGSKGEKAVWMAACRWVRAALSRQPPAAASALDETAEFVKWWDGLAPRNPKNESWHDIALEAWNHRAALAAAKPEGGTL